MTDSWENARLGNARLGLKNPKHGRCQKCPLGLQAVCHVSASICFHKDRLKAELRTGPDLLTLTGGNMENKGFSRREFIKVAAGSAVVTLGSGGCAFFSECKAKNKPRGNYKVFSKGKIGSLDLKNHIVKAATDVGATNDDCSFMSEGLGMYKEWSRGGAGLIISGHMTVVPQSGKNFVFNHNLTCIHDDRFIPQLSKMAGVVHDADSDCKILAQINHIGMDSTTEPVSASSVPWPFVKKQPHALSVSEILELEDLYLAAAKRAKIAGFDGIQLHGAHSFLLNTFLTPFSNKRTDQYGGSMKNMVRIVREMTDKIKSSLGSDFPVLIKINGFAKLPFDGIDADAFPRFLHELSGTGLDAIEISEDKDTDEAKRQVRHAMYDEKVSLSIPLIMTGGNASVEDVERLSQQGTAEYFGFARSLIREPDLPNRWLEKVGDAGCECIFCDACVDYLLEGRKLVTCQEI